MMNTGQIFAGRKVTPEQIYYSMADLQTEVSLPIRKIRELIADGKFPRSIKLPIMKRRKNKKTKRYELKEGFGERWHRREIEEWQSTYWDETTKKDFDVEF